MVRPASGKAVLEDAKKLLKKARTAEELRQAQAVILPLDFGFSMQEVAEVIGTSSGWACQLRMEFIRSDGKKSREKDQRGGRHRENMSPEEEKQFLAPFFDKAMAGGTLVVGEIKKALDKRLGRTTALSSTYNLLHRHNWRKLTPDKSHPKSDAVAQDE